MEIKPLFEKIRRDLNYFLFYKKMELIIFKNEFFLYFSSENDTK